MIKPNTMHKAVSDFSYIADVLNEFRKKKGNTMGVDNSFSDCLKPKYIVSEIDRFAICYLTESNKIVSIGVSICSDEDIFNETIGKEISFKRAKKALFTAENSAKIARNDVFCSDKVWSIYYLIANHVRIRISPYNMYKSMTVSSSSTYKKGGIK